MADWSWFLGLATCVLIVLFPFYRLEMMRYTEVVNACQEAWIRDAELIRSPICSNVEVRERQRKNVNCERAFENVKTLISDCAFAQWWATFLPVTTYWSVAGSWYAYGLVALIAVVLVKTWVESRARVETRRLELSEQRSALREFSRHLLGSSNNNPSRALMPRRRHHRDDDDGFPIMYQRRNDVGGPRIEEYD